MTDQIPDDIPRPPGTGFPHDGTEPAMVRFWIGIAEYAGVDPAIIGAGGMTISSVGQDENALITWEGQAFIPIDELDRIANEAITPPEDNTDG